MAKENGRNQVFYRGEACVIQAVFNLILPGLRDDYTSLHILVSGFLLH